MKRLCFLSKSASLLLMSVSLSIPLSFLLPSYVQCLDYPGKPINVVISFSPGGPADLQARILADVASKELKVPIIVTNKPGGGGGVAASFVATQKPDGYTLLVTNAGTMTANFALFPNLPYKRADFQPLFMSNIVPVNVAVKTESPWKTLKDFFEAARKNPGKLRSGSASAAITMVWEGLLRHERVDVTHLLYKGAADVVVSIMGGHSDIFVDSVTPIVSQVDAKQMRLLVAMGSKRNGSYPDISTLQEIGYSKFAKDFWNGFFAPVGIPESIMKKIVHTFEKALSQPDVRARLEQAGVIPNYLGPKDFSKVIDEQYEFYMELSKQKK